MNNTNNDEKITEPAVEEVKEEPVEEVKEEVKKNNTITLLSSFDTIVLAGGAGKGIVTLGALQYAYDNYLLTGVKNYVGTSAGALISYLLIIGYTPVEIVVYICTNKILEKLQSFNIVSMINGEGACSFSPMQEQLERMTITKTGRLFNMRELYNYFNKKFICTTYNRTKKQGEYLDYINNPELPCLIALRMSANLPFIFDKFQYEGNYYIDGGVCNNFPIEIGDSIGNKILGLNIENDTSDFDVDIADSNILDEIYELMFIPINQMKHYRCLNASNKCKIVSLKYPGIKIFDFNISSKTKLDMFSVGYSQMKKSIEN